MKNIVGLTFSIVGDTLLRFTISIEQDNHNR